MWCVYCTKLEPISKIGELLAFPARYAPLCEAQSFPRMESAGNAYALRSPSTATTPKEKTLLAFLIWRGWIFSENGKGVFSFGVSVLQVFGQAECKYNADSVLRNYFLGIGFCKTETNLFWRKFEFGFPRGGGVWGGIRAGFLNFLAGGYCWILTNIL